MESCRVFYFGESSESVVEQIEALRGEIEQGVEMTPPAEHDSATEPQGPALRNGRRFLR